MFSILFKSKLICIAMYTYVWDQTIEEIHPTRNPVEYP